MQVQLQVLLLQRARKQLVPLLLLCHRLCRGRCCCLRRQQSVERPAAPALPRVRRRRCGRDGAEVGEEGERVCHRLSNLHARARQQCSKRRQQLQQDPGSSQQQARARTRTCTRVRVLT